MAPPPATVSHQKARELSRGQIESVGRLIHLAFPNPDCTVRDRVDEYARSCQAPDREVFTVWRDGQLLAHAVIFPRNVLPSTGGALRVMALAAVCSDPACRGAGWGRTVTRAAFAEVDSGRFAVSLLQTGVPEFYAKLGARTVANAFVNSSYDPTSATSRRLNVTRDTPWWNPHIMIYPATFAWPEGIIDLQGPGY